MESFCCQRSEFSPVFFSNKMFAKHHQAASAINGYQSQEYEPFLASDGQNNVSKHDLRHREVQGKIELQMDNEVTNILKDQVCLDKWLRTVRNVFSPTAHFAPIEPKFHGVSFNSVVDVLFLPMEPPVISISSRARSGTYQDIKKSFITCGPNSCLQLHEMSAFSSVKINGLHCNRVLCKENDLDIEVEEIMQNQVKYDKKMRTVRNVFSPTAHFAPLQPRFHGVSFEEVTDVIFLPMFPPVISEPKSMVPALVQPQQKEFTNLPVLPFCTGVSIQTLPVFLGLLDLPEIRIKDEMICNEVKEIMQYQVKYDKHMRTVRNVFSPTAHFAPLQPKFHGISFNSVVDVLFLPMEPPVISISSRARSGTYQDIKKSFITCGPNSCLQLHEMSAFSSVKINGLHCNRVLCKENDLDIEVEEIMQNQVKYDKKMRTIRNVFSPTAHFAPLQPRFHGVSFEEVTDVIFLPMFPPVISEPKSMVPALVQPQQKEFTNLPVLPFCTGVSIQTLPVFLGLLDLPEIRIKDEMICNEVKEIMQYQVKYDKHMRTVRNVFSPTAHFAPLQPRFHGVSFEEVTDVMFLPMFPPVICEPRTKVTSMVHPQQKEDFTNLPVLPFCTGVAIQNLHAFLDLLRLPEIEIKEDMISHEVCSIFQNQVKINTRHEMTKNVHSPTLNFQPIEQRYHGVSFENKEDLIYLPYVPPVFCFPKKSLNLQETRNPTFSSNGVKTEAIDVHFKEVQSNEDYVLIHYDASKKILTTMDQKSCSISLLNMAIFAVLCTGFRLKLLESHQCTSTPVQEQINILTSCILIRKYMVKECKAFYLKVWMLYAISNANALLFPTKQPSLLHFQDIMRRERLKDYQPNWKYRRKSIFV